MVKKISTIVMLCLFFVGLSVLLYPSISSYWNSKTQSAAVKNYEDLLEAMKGEDHTALFEEAESYNEALAELENPLLDYPEVEGYHEILNPTGSGMMGYLTIPTIGVELPIYHTVSEDVLSHAAGHMEGTSFPIPGKSTHTVLSAHRGLPNAKLFTDLNKLVVGDVFTITVLDKVFTYQVEQILTVLPENTQNIKVEQGEEYCTLLTCTPYGINTHRLLVQAKRVDAVSNKTTYVGAEAYQIDTLIVTPIVALPILLTLIVIVCLQPVKKERIIQEEGEEEL